MARFEPSVFCLVVVKFGFVGEFQIESVPQIAQWGRGPMWLIKMATDVSFPWPIIVF